MADLPILFSAPMVREILREIEAPGTGKTQTRRVLTPWTDEHPAFVEDGIITAFDEHERAYRWPRTKAVGDRLYVREAIRFCQQMDAIKPSKLSKGEPRIYDADGFLYEPVCLMIQPGKLRPPMFMPLWASRITLLVTGVKVERLQDCSEADAVAEGCRGFVSSDGEDGLSPLEEYRGLWDQINGPGAWDANPWVAAYTFKPVLGNIDRIREQGGA